jgi:thymidylate kinase
MIVEFVGQVGGGKTTNCNHFSKLLKENGFIIYMLSDLKNYYHRKSLFNKFYIIIRTFIHHGIDLIRFILLLGQFGIFSLDSIIRFGRLCVRNVTLQEFKKQKKFDILLLDQWIIQGLWSATIFKHDSYDVLHKKLRKFYFKTDVVLFFHLDFETAAKRIEARHTYTSRFDRMNFNQRLAKLKKYSGYLFKMFQNSDCNNKKEFSALESPEKNAEDFLYELKYMLTSD